MDKNAEGTQGNWEQPWPCAETLKTLAELNEQCLERSAWTLGSY
jgi:hypothetical protein